MTNLDHDLAYLLLIFGLVVFPRALQRFRIPGALTCFALGMLAVLFPGDTRSSGALALMATLGISSLFLFAGLEVRLDDLVRNRWPLLAHICVRAASVGVFTYVATHYFGFSSQAGALLALALLTPSTGFILETLPALGLGEDERYWVRIKAIAGELFALAVLFLVLQSSSISTLALSSLALLVIAAGIPVLFILLGRHVMPYARGSEFSMLVMIGVVAAFATYQLGVYYLVGAFMVGFAARLLRQRMPLLASDENLHAIQMFASFFVPFYFFQKGMSVPSGTFSFQAMALGAALSLSVLPLRIGIVWLQRRVIKREAPRGSLRVAAALTPTLIFTLVLASILRERFGASDTLYGALLIYAGISTMLPSLVLAKPVEFDVGAGTKAQACAHDEPRSAA